jgi:hypothetical protein
MRALWPTGQKLTFANFLADPRLVRWYAQNYDLVGCNLYTCSPFKAGNNTGSNSLGDGPSSLSTISSTGPSIANGGMKAGDSQILSKVVPIPIGVDLHSAAEKKVADPQKASALVCGQLAALKLEQKRALPFPQRKMAVVAEFGCGFDSTKIGMARSKTRGEICKLIAKHKGTVSAAKLKLFLDVSGSATASTGVAPDNVAPIPGSSDSGGVSLGSGASDVAVVITNHDDLIYDATKSPTSRSKSILGGAGGGAVAAGGAGAGAGGGSEKDSPHINTASESFGDKRSSFWRKVGAVAFALSPPGYGMDTHRLWEILQMGAVPITVHSPLDALYSQFPVVLVHSWAEVFEPGALAKFKQDILHRFPEMAGTGGGGASRSTPSYREKLEAAYWADLIAADKKKILAIK